MFTEAYLRAEGLVGSWHASPGGGFWRPGPHLVLEQSLCYPKTQVVLERYLVCEPDGRVESYHIWKHHYRPDQIKEIVERAGLAVVGLFGDLAGEPYREGSRWIGVVARAPLGRQGRGTVPDGS